MLPKYFYSSEFRYFKRWSIIGILIGIGAGIGSILLYSLLNIGTRLFLGNTGFVPPTAGQSLSKAISWVPSHNPLLLIPIITIGGLISGFIVYKYAPEAAGGGTDVAIRAFHKEGGKIRKRVPIIKMIASVMTMSTGGSGGREGPIAQITAGFGSFVADALKLNERDRRIAVAVGIGAGIGSIFKAPLGGAILSIEILYKRDYENDVLISSVIASIVGYSIFCLYDGFTPLFSAQIYHWNIYQIPLYMILGVAAAFFGILYKESFSYTKSFFDRLKVRNYFKPAIGAFLVGVIAVILIFLFPQFKGAAGFGAIGMGYGFIQLALYNALPIDVIVILIFAKIVMTSLTIGSGGSGGEIVPGFLIGAMTGEALGKIFAITLPRLVSPDMVPAFAMIGMAALLGGIGKVPIAVLIMVSEMTGDYSLLMPAMVAIVGSYALTGSHSLFMEQVDTRIHSPAHSNEYFNLLLKLYRVKDAMRKEFPTVEEKDSLQQAMLKMRHGISALPVIKEGEMRGLIRLRDLLEHPMEKWQDMSIGDLMRHKYATVTPDTSLREALDIMEERDVGTLVIITPRAPQKPLGIILKRDVIRIGEAKFGEKSDMYGESIR